MHILQGGKDGTRFPISGKENLVNTFLPEKQDGENKNKTILRWLWISLPVKQCRIKPI